MIVIYSPGQGSPDRGSPGLSESFGLFFPCTPLPPICLSPSSPTWAASSLGRGIPETQGIPASRLIRDFPSHSSHPWSLSAVPRPQPSGCLLAQLPPLQGPLLLRHPTKSSSHLGTPSHSCWNGRSISKGSFGEFKMNLTVITPWQNSEFQPVLVFF